MFKDDQGDGVYEEIIKKILCFGCLLLTISIIFLTIFAIYLGGTSFVILGIGGIIFSISLYLICWTPYKAKTYAIPLIIGIIPLYMLLPGKGSHNPNGLLEYRTIFDSASPWFSGVSEQDLVYMGEKMGYTEGEKKSLENKGGLAKDYEGLDETNLYQYNASVVLDSWFFDRGHYWFYRPQSKKRPLLIFLHGSGGNFKAYQKWFTPFAQKYDVAMAFPTWGMGKWSYERLGTRIKDVITDIRKDYEIDSNQIFLCGLSQGSLTGIKTISKGKFKPKAFISISGIPYLTSNEIRVLAETPIYIIHGAKDERVPVSNPKTIVSKLKNINSNISYDEYPEQDHTLIKVKTVEILEKIFVWIIK